MTYPTPSRPTRDRHRAAQAAASLGAGAGLVAWGVARGFTPVRPTSGAVLALVLAAGVWAAWRALDRHRALAAAARGPYLVRHGGLAWGVGLWSALSYALARPQLAAASGAEERAWIVALLAAVTLPVTLWGGIAFRRALERGLGI